MLCFRCFFFNDTATTEIYTLSLHDALPICAPISACVCATASQSGSGGTSGAARSWRSRPLPTWGPLPCVTTRSEEHTSEIQSRQYLVCRLLLEKKKNKICHIKS